MFQNLVLFIDIFRKGASVADVVKGKKWGALAGVLGTLIVALAQAAKAFGYDLHIDTDTATQIGTGIAALAGVFVTFGTSDKVGLLPAKRVPAEVDGSPGLVAQGEGAVAAQAPGQPEAGMQPQRPEPTGPAGDFMP